MKERDKTLIMISLLLGLLGLYIYLTFTASCCRACL